MTCDEMYRQLSVGSKFNKEDVRNLFEAYAELVKDSVATGSKIPLPMLGTFKVKVSAARVARNPQNGSEINVPAFSLPKFEMSPTLRKSFKEAK